MAQSLWLGLSCYSVPRPLATVLVVVRLVSRLKNTAKRYYFPPNTTEVKCKYCLMSLMVLDMYCSLCLSFFFKQTPYLISVCNIDLSYCTFDFLCKKEDLSKMCRSCYYHKQNLMLSRYPVLPSAFPLDLRNIFPHIFNYSSAYIHHRWKLWQINPGRKVLIL